MDWDGSEPTSSGYYAGPRPFSGPEAKGLKRLIKRLPLQPCRGQGLPGTVTKWQRDRGGTAFVVELEDGRLSGPELRRNARAAATVGAG